MSIEEVVDNGTHRTVEVYNKYRQGYKYNLPKGLSIVDNSEYNEVIVSNKYKYFLYVDAVSYHNKIIEKYEENDKSHISMAIDYEDKFGYLEINNVKDDKYLVEIMYNYAKIEVIVNGEDIKVVVANALSILTSVKFNDNILNTLLNEEVSQFKEYEFNIFETSTTTESDYLESIENDIYEEEDDVHDSDLIN
jgi:hypothetical protein